MNALIFFYIFSSTDVRHVHQLSICCVKFHNGQDLLFSSSAGGGGGGSLLAHLHGHLIFFTDQCFHSPERHLCFDGKNHGKDRRKIVHNIKVKVEKANYNITRRFLKKFVENKYLSSRYMNSSA